MTCVRCGKPLTFNELGLNAKYNPQEEKFCLACLAQKLDVPPGRLREKIEEFLRAGCKMFAEERAN